MDGKIEYSNIKEKIFGELGRPLDEYLDKHNIEEGWTILILLSFYFYLTIFHNRPQNKKFSIFEKIMISAWVFLAFYCVLSQVLMIAIK